MKPKDTKGTFPITNGTKIPFPCWLRHPYVEDFWLYITTRTTQSKAWLASGYTHFSTNGPDDRPEDVGAEQGPGEEDGPWSPGWEERSKPAGKVEISSNPKDYGMVPVENLGGGMAAWAPSTLAQLAEGAAKKMFPSNDSDQEATTEFIKTLRAELAQSLLAVFSPEWERMVRENEELTRNLEGARRVNARLTQVDFRNADIIDKLQEERDTLRAEVQRLVADKESFVKLFEANPSASWSQVATLRAENERLTKERNDYKRLFNEANDAAKGLPVELKPAGVISALRARVRELEEDGKRLDWLEKTSRYADLERRGLDWADSDIRAAIDTARKETP